ESEYTEVEIKFKVSSTIISNKDENVTLQESKIIQEQNTYFILNENGTFILQG
ncbi:unnamed protein product, partial [marine sediment metagenome]